MNCWAGSQNLLLEMPELYVGKLTRTVLRGKGGVTRRTTRWLEINSINKSLELIK